MKIKITKASPVDKKAVLNLSLYFPDDYLEEVVDRWINQEAGGLFLAWHNGGLVGCCALSFPSPTEGWLHGMRVHPDYQGQGIAFELNSYLIDQAKSRDAEVIRLLTAPDNYGALRVSTRLGFKAASEKRKIIYREAISRKKNTILKHDSPLRLCPGSDLAEIIDFLFSNKLKETSRALLFVPGYSYRLLTAEYLAQAIRNNEVYRFPDHGPLQGLVVVVRNKNEQHLVLGYINTPPEIFLSIASMIPMWANEGYCYFSLNLLHEQHLILLPYLKQLFGTYETLKWLLMEKFLIQS